MTFLLFFRFSDLHFLSLDSFLTCTVLTTQSGYEEFLGAVYRVSCYVLKDSSHVLANSALCDKVLITLYVIEII